MKIAVLGDSHVAALKMAWQDLATTYPDTQLTFFASRGDGLSGLKAEGSALVPGNETLRGHLRFTSGGLDSVVPGQFDLVVIYGLRLVLELDEEKGVYSSAVCAAVRHDQIDGCLSMTTLRKLRSICDVPCIVGPTPLTVSANPAAAPLSAETLTSLERALQTDALDALDATLVGPPLAALLVPLNTDRRFVDKALTLAVGDFRDGSKVRAQNQRHMNAEYGKLWLLALFSRLQPGSPVPPNAA